MSQKSGKDAPGRGGAPRRLGDILGSALDRMATTEQARAYAAWARACGDEVARKARPRHFSRGVLTVECASSVWTNELTLLGGKILARMDEVASGHPVTRLRFVVERATRQEERPLSVAKEERRDTRPAPPDVGEARMQAEGVRDERLREAIEAALRASSEESPETPGRGTPRG